MVHLYAGNHDAAGSGYYDSVLPYLAQYWFDKYAGAFDFAVFLRSGVFHLSDDAVYGGYSQRA